MWLRRIAARRATSGRVGQDVAEADSAGEEFADVEDHAFGALRVGDLEPRAGVQQQPRVADLAAGLAVEARAVEDEHRLFARADLVAEFLADHDAEDGAFALVLLVSLENGGRAALLQRRDRAAAEDVGGDFRPLARALALALHLRLELVRVGRHALVLEQRLRHVERQAVRVEQAEGFAAGQLLLAGGAHFLDVFLEDRLALVERLVEALLLDADEAGDVLAPLGQVGILVLHHARDDRDEAVEERRFLRRAGRRRARRGG